MPWPILTKPSTLSSRATIHPRAGDGVMSKSSTWNSLTRRRSWDQSRDSSKTGHFVLSTDSDRSKNFYPGSADWEEADFFGPTKAECLFHLARINSTRLKKFTQDGGTS